MPHRKDKVIGGNAKLVRNINRSAILNLIREKQPISRVDISRITGLNKSTVSSIVSELTELEYLVEELYSDNNVGRNPLLLSLRYSRYHVGAINFDTNQLRVAIFDIGGQVVVKKEVQMKDNSPEAYVATSLQTLSELQSEKKIKKLEGIGVTITGLIDHESGFVLVAPNLGWKEVHLNKIFAKYAPNLNDVRFENDAEASALAELWFGKEVSQYSNFVFVSVGSGLGTGIVINRKVVEGVSFAAGEFGHMNIFADGADCVCGSSGCWEAYASDRATIKRYLEIKKTNHSPKASTDIQSLVQLALQNDKDAITALRQTGQYLGIGMANIIRALDPPAIVVGGQLLKVWSIIYNDILEGLSKRSFFGLEKQVKIIPSSIREKPRLVGAATLALEGIFMDYKITK